MRLSSIRKTINIVIIINVQISNSIICTGLECIILTLRVFVEITGRVRSPI